MYMNLRSRKRAFAGDYPDGNNCRKVFKERHITSDEAVTAEEFRAERAQASEHKVDAVQYQDEPAGIDASTGMDNSVRISESKLCNPCEPVDLQEPEKQSFDISTFGGGPSQAVGSCPAASMAQSIQNGPVAFTPLPSQSPLASDNAENLQLRPKLARTRSSDILLWALLLLICLAYYLTSSEVPDFVIASADAHSLDWAHDLLRMSADVPRDCPFADEYLRHCRYTLSVQPTTSSYVARDLAHQGSSSHTTIHVAVLGRINCDRKDCVSTATSNLDSQALRNARSVVVLEHATAERFGNRNQAGAYLGAAAGDQDSGRFFLHYHRSPGTHSPSPAATTVSVLLLHGDCVEWHRLLSNDLNVGAAGDEGADWAAANGAAGAAAAMGPEACSYNHQAASPAAVAAAAAARSEMFGRFVRWKVCGEAVFPAGTIFVDVPPGAAAEFAVRAITLAASAAAATTTAAPRAAGDLAAVTCEALVAAASAA